MNVLRKPFPYREYRIVFWLIGLNVLVFLAEMFLGEAILVTELGRFRVNRVVYQFSMIPTAIRDGSIWRFVTYMFVHDPSNITHLLFNMLALFIFGFQVERRMGSYEFLTYYLVTGTLAGVFSFIVYWFTGNRIVFLMGASGAIFAVELAYATMFPHSVIRIWGILPVKAPIMVLGFAGIEIFFMITGRNSNVAHFTHLAGFAFGWIYFLIRYGINPWKEMRR